MTEVDRPDPEDDPFACSKCGCGLGTVKRLRGDDYCEGCRIELDPSIQWVQCLDCGRDIRTDRAEAIDVSPESEYYPRIQYLCRSCADTEEAVNDE